MRDPILRGICLLGLFWGLGVAETSAQYAIPAPAPARGTPIPLPNTSRPTAPTATSGGHRDPQFRRTQATPADDQPPVPTTRPAPSTTEPTNANETDLSLPRSEKESGGGEPTEEKAEEEKKDEETKEEEKPAAADTTLLMKFLGMEDSKVKLYGWIENSFTGNTRGTPRNDLNFGVNPNFEANRWMGNQYYFIIENPLEQNDKINFGYRLDNLFGNDWQFNHMRGLNEHSFRLNHFAGYDPAQIYAEVHLPFLTKGGIDVKGGRFYTILGYEVVPAIGRPLLSVPYMFNYGQPFTHLGVLSTFHVTDRVNWYNGLVNGYDRWFSNDYKWNYLGGVTWTSENGKANLAISYIMGPNQYPHFLQPGTPIVLPGNTPPPYLAGRRNLGYGANNRVSFTTVFSYKWSDKLTQVVETDESYENNIPGTGPGGTNNNNQWYSLGNWFLYQCTDKFTAVWRSEVFRDNGGQRTGFSDNFYEITVGGIWKPKSWLWIRPEIRGDWTQFTHPYFDGTKKSQLTIGGDIILLF